MVIWYYLYLTLIFKCTMYLFAYAFSVLQECVDTLHILQVQKSIFYEVEV